MSKCNCEILLQLLRCGGRRLPLAAGRAAVGARSRRRAAECPHAVLSRDAIIVLATTPARENHTSFCADCYAGYLFAERAELALCKARIRLLGLLQLVIFCQCFQQHYCPCHRTCQCSAVRIRHRNRTCQCSAVRITCQLVEHPSVAA